MLRGHLHDTLASRLAAVLGVAGAPRRVALVGSQLLGIGGSPLRAAAGAARVFDRFTRWQTLRAVLQVTAPRWRASAALAALAG
jgi:hypothetical protein